MTVSRWERGVTGSIDLRHHQNLAEALNISLDEFDRQEAAYRASKAGAETDAGQWLAKLDECSGVDPRVEVGGHRHLDDEVARAGLSSQRLPWQPEPITAFMGTWIDGNLPVVRRSPFLAWLTPFGC